MFTLSCSYPRSHLKFQQSCDLGIIIPYLAVKKLRPRDDNLLKVGAVFLTFRIQYEDNLLMRNRGMDISL